MLNIGIKLSALFLFYKVLIVHVLINYFLFSCSRFYERTFQPVHLTALLHYYVPVNHKFQIILILSTDEIVEMIRETAGVKLDVSHPVIEFKTDDATASIRVGKGFLKVTASIRASVVWENDTLVVDVKSVEFT